MEKHEALRVVERMHQRTGKRLAAATRGQLDDLVLELAEGLGSIGAVAGALRTLAEELEALVAEQDKEADSERAARAGLQTNRFFEVVDEPLGYRGIGGPAPRHAGIQIEDAE
jgi:hypothetical protein